MELILNNFYLFIGFIPIVLIAIGLGGVLLTYSIKPVNELPTSFVFGASYFLGISFYIVFFKIMYLLFSDIGVSLYLMFGLACLLIILNIKKLAPFIHVVINSKFMAMYWLILFFIVCIILLGKWLPTDEFAPFFLKSIGSLHSPRYGWVSNYIEYCEFIPILGQNTGQSILTFITGYILTPKPYLFLFLWLVVSVFFFGLVVYGMLLKYTKDSTYLWWGVIVFLFGNTALSLTHVLVIDSGSPFFFNGYSDTFIGTFSIFFTLMLFDIIQQKKHSFTLWWVILLIMSVNYLSAPQNIVIIFSIFILASITKVINKYSAYYLLSAFLLSTFLFVPQGGMLTPSSYHTNINYIGVMSVADGAAEHGASERALNLSPGYQYYYDGISGWKSDRALLLHKALEYKKNLPKDIASLVWTLERIVINSIVVLFFPMAGLIYLRKKCKLESSLSEKSSFRYLYLFGILTFIIGLLISFPFSLNGYKWELSRFMIPGIAIGMLGFSLFIVNQMKRTAKNRVLAMTLSIMVIFGPVSTQLTVANINIFDNPSMKMDTLLSSGPEKSEYSCNLKRLSEDDSIFPVASSSSTFEQKNEFKSLIESNDRIMLIEESEKKLYKATELITKQLTEKQDYKIIMRSLTDLKDVIDTFFEAVIVNSDDL